MRYPFEPPDFKPGDLVRVIPPSPEAPAPGPCGHTPFEKWEGCGAEPSMIGTVILGLATYPVICPLCETEFDQEGIGVSVPGRPSFLSTPWTLELINAT